MYLKIKINYIKFSTKNKELKYSIFLYLKVIFYSIKKKINIMKITKFKKKSNKFLNIYFNFLKNLIYEFN